MDEFALDNDSAGTDDGAGGVEDYEDEIGGGDGGDVVVAFEKGVVGGLADCGEDAEGVEEACGRLVVGRR